MRERVERKATRTATDRPAKTGTEATGTRSLLALQRSAGNAAVVAMLEAGAFGSAPDPSPRSSTGETIRRLWSVPGMAVKKFKAVALGARPQAATLIHSTIERRLEEYAAALEFNDLKLANKFLSEIEWEVRAYLRKNPAGRGDWSASDGLQDFLAACADERQELEALRRAEDEQGAAGPTAAWTATGTAATGKTAASSSDGDASATSGNLRAAPLTEANLRQHDAMNRRAQDRADAARGTGAAAAGPTTLATARGAGANAAAPASTLPASAALAAAMFPPGKVPPWATAPPPKYQGERPDVWASTWSAWVQQQYHLAATAEL